MSSKTIRQADLITLTATFAALDDPRQARGIRHLLCDILVISVLAVICGATNYALIHTFAVHRQDWLRRFLELPGGIPSQDTFERIFGIVAPDTFRAVFCGWIQEIPSQALPEGEREVFAIDGKTSRGTASQAFAAIHTVSVYSVQFQLVLEAITVPVKANEITVLPALIEAVAPVGGIVTIDAMGCQKNVAATIRTFPGTDYLLALKGNHKKLEQDVHWLFGYHDQYGWEGVDYEYAVTEERGHGRLEKRECWVMRELDFLEERGAWKDLNALVRVRSTRTVGQKTSVEERFYLTSMRDHAALILRTSRLHWGIENQLHWVLDVVFDDDASKVKNRIAAQNWVMVRQMAAHLLRREGTGKGSLASKQFRATMDLQFLERVLTLR